MVGEIASSIGREPAQVVLRWQIQRGSIIFPKSMHRDRMVENMQIFDFELNEEQVERIDALHQGEDGRQGPNPNTMDRV